MAFGAARGVWPRLAWAACFGCVAGSAAWQALAEGKKGWAVVAATVAAVVGAFAPSVTAWLTGRETVNASVLKRTARALAEEALRRVRTNPLRVRLHQPAPLRVRFRSAEGVGAARTAVFAESDVGWDDRPLVGNVEVAAERLRELPWQQLVVIGEPGAGKSVLALMLVDQLLSAPAKGDPVPVLVGLSSWNPREETVERFVARRLVEDFGVSRRVADRLLSQPRIVDGVGARWWVMPVLDGLDEVHADLRADALLEVDRFAASDRPVVVTCRIREFQRTEGKARALSRAAVVRLEPLEPEDVVQFLSHSGTHADRWEPVFETLRSQPTGELARVLSTPLMAGMAKDVYSKADPGELVAQATRNGSPTGSSMDMSPQYTKRRSMESGTGLRTRCDGCEAWRIWLTAMGRVICGGGVFPGRI